MEGSYSLHVPRKKHSKAKTETYLVKALGYIKMKADGTLSGVLHGMRMQPLHTFNV